METTVIAQTNGEQQKAPRRPRPLISRAWSENFDDVEVPGTPKTPRTSTTPGLLLFKNINKNNQKFQKHSFEDINLTRPGTVYLLD